MLVIGQSLECWRRPLAGAVARREAAPLIARARRQVDAGATALDVNFGAAPRAGLAADLVWAARALRAELSEVRLFLDCGDLDAIVAALEAVAGPAVVNAIPLHEGDRANAERVVEAAARVGAGVVFSPRTADESEDDRAILDAAGSAQEMAARAGVRGPVYLDCLTYPLVSHLEHCRRSLRWVATLRESGPPGVEPLVAIGNLGHGAAREQRLPLQMVYLTLAATAGAGAAILPVEDGALMSLVGALDGLTAPRTDFEAWARGLLEDGERDEPPAGDGPRAAWELLRPRQGDSSASRHGAPTR